MFTLQHSTKQEEILHMLYITVLHWFNDNSMKANPVKYHLLLSGNDPNKITIGNKTVSRSKCEKTFKN